MLQWVRKKLAARKKQRKRKADAKVRKTCIHCKLWDEHFSYERAAKGTFMPTLSFIVRPCKLHATELDERYYSRMHKK